MPLGHRSFGRADRIVERFLLGLHLGLGRCSHPDDGDAARQLGEALFELLAVVVAGRLLDLDADLSEPCVDTGAIAATPDQGGVLLVGDHPCGATELLEGGIFQFEPDLLRDHLRAGKDGNIFQHGLAPVAESGRLDCAGLEHAAKLIDDEGRQRFALDVLGDDQKRPAALGDLLEQGNQIAQGPDLVITEQHVGILQYGFHAVGIRDEVGRQEAAIELHAFHDFQQRLGGLGLLHRDHAVTADLLDRIRHQLTDGEVVVRRDRGDLDLFRPGLHRLRHGVQGGDGGLRPAIEAAFEVDRARAGDDVPDAVRKDGMGQDGRRAGAVADDIAGFLGGPAAAPGRPGSLPRP
ncbi:hypothetical protein ABIA43_004966 [Bradyrhizobium sp. USDA 328]